jgi:hypothetical protein
MSQNDLVIANQSFPATRADINSALQALGSLNSGATEPATTYAHMPWSDTTTDILKVRSAANDAWISIGYFDQSANAFRILDDTQVTDTSGTQTGLLGDQATATWESGSGTTESLVSPAKVKAAVAVLVTAAVIGTAQTWQNVKSSRSTNTTYQNTTGRPICVALESNGGSASEFQASVNGSNWVRLGIVTANAADIRTFSGTIPPNGYYRVTSGAAINVWAELR